LDAANAYADGESADNRRNRIAFPDSSEALRILAEKDSLSDSAPDCGFGPGSAALAFAQDARADELAANRKMPSGVYAVMLVSEPPR
jgi:hypothetical protein